MFIIHFHFVTNIKLLQSKLASYQEKLLLVKKNMSKSSKIKNICNMS